MSSRATIESQMKVIAKEQNRKLAPLHDNLTLLDSGFDSLCFAILVSRLEDELAVDPFLELDGAEFPKTFGELVAFYDRSLV